MVRTILAVIAGYAVMVVVVLALMAIIVLTSSQIFVTAHSLEARPTTIIKYLIGSAIAAVLGGWTCAAIGRNWRCVISLAIVVLILGIISAIGNSMRPSAELTAGQIAALPILEKLQYSRQPDWYAFTLPIIGAIGALLGGWLKLPKSR